MYNGISTASKRTIDVHTEFTLAKPNDQDTNFGRFKMDDFTVYYKALSPSDIKKVSKGGMKTRDPIAVDFRGCCQGWCGVEILGGGVTMSNRIGQ